MLRTSLSPVSPPACPFPTPGQDPQQVRDRQPSEPFGPAPAGPACVPRRRQCAPRALPARDAESPGVTEPTRPRCLATEPHEQSHLPTARCGRGLLGPPSSPRRAPVPSPPAPTAPQQSPCSAARLPSGRRVTGTSNRARRGPTTWSRLRGGGAERWAPPPCACAPGCAGRERPGPLMGGVWSLGLARGRGGVGDSRLVPPINVPTWPVFARPCALLSGWRD